MINVQVKDGIIIGAGSAEFTRIPGDEIIQVPLDQPPDKVMTHWEVKDGKLEKRLVPLKVEDTVQPDVLALLLDQKLEKLVMMKMKATALGDPTIEIDAEIEAIKDKVKPK